MVRNRNNKVTVAYSFLFQSDASAKSGFKVIQERTVPSECSIRYTKEGKVILRITRLLENSEEALSDVKEELESDLKRYGGEFQNWKYHVISSNGLLKPKVITHASTLLAWLTPPGDARNYRTYKMPFYSLVFVLALGLIVVLWA
ncbi:hypothetical protein KUL156_56820 [Alteromonas sp. KUL156]|nr:hypothetical protein KUL154_53500 [Alteromonas sp. KUL154]GFE03090.1 hypothetical protein KUL156_56820 [Alteromonas sp. KUL156]